MQKEVQIMAKINWDEVYQDRIKEIDNQIKTAIRRKHWDIKKSLECEKNKLLQLLN